MGLSTIPEQASHIASSTPVPFIFGYPSTPHRVSHHSHLCLSSPDTRPGRTTHIISHSLMPFFSGYPSRLHNAHHISFTHAFLLRISVHSTLRNRPPPPLIHLIVLLRTPITISNIFIPFFAKNRANLFILNNAYSVIGISKAKRGFRLPQSYMSIISIGPTIESTRRKSYVVR